MIKNKLLLGLFITLLLIPVSTEAISFDSVKIFDSIKSDGSVTETLQITITNSNNKNFQFNLPSSAKNVKVNRPYELIDSILNIDLSCAECKLEVSYDLGYVVKRESSEQRIFTRALNLPGQIDHVKYEVEIPPGFIIGLVDESNDPPTIPNPSNIWTDGKSIVVSWEEKNPEFPKIYFLAYHNNEVPESALKELEKELGEWPVLLYILLSLFIGFFLGFKYVKRKSDKKEKTDNKVKHIIPNSMFTPDEKKILQTIKENSGLTQKDIGKNLEWSKSKVSAIMSNLEYKKIVKREKIGRNYKVELVHDNLEL